MTPLLLKEKGSNSYNLLFLTQIRKKKKEERKKQTLL